MALCGYVFSEICYRHLPPLHAILQQKQTNLPRQFLCQRFCLQTGIPDCSFSGHSGKHGKINNLANQTTKKTKQGQETIENTDEKSFFAGAIHVSRVWGRRSRNFAAKIRHGSPKVFRRRGPRAQPFLGNRSKVKRKKNQSGHSLSPYIDVMTGTVGLIVDQKSGGCKSGGNYNMFFQKNE